MADYQSIEYIQKTIQALLESMDISARIEYEDSLASGLVFNIRSRDAKMLIGRQGATLYALEHLVHSIVSRNLSQTKSETDNRIFFSIDVDDYKRNRQYQIKQLVKDSVLEMKRTGQPIDLPDMPKPERKFVHMYIQEQFPHITTASVGDEPRRYIKLTI
jgi:spoIIIJ-associated protein